MVVGFAITWWYCMIHPCSLMIHPCVGTSMRCWQIAPMLKLLSQASTFGFFISATQKCSIKVLSLTVKVYPYLFHLLTEEKGRHERWGYLPKILQEAEAGKDHGVQPLCDAEPIFLLRESEEIQQVAIFRCTSAWLSLKANEAVAPFSQATWWRFPCPTWCAALTVRCGFEERWLPFQNSHQRLFLGRLQTNVIHPLESHTKATGISLHHLETAKLCGNDVKLSGVCFPGMTKGKKSTAQRCDPIRTSAKPNACSCGLLWQLLYVFSVNNGRNGDASAFLWTFLQSSVVSLLDCCRKGITGKAKKCYLMVQHHR